MKSQQIRQKLVPPSATNPYFGATEDMGMFLLNINQHKNLDV